MFTNCRPVSMLLATYFWKKSKSFFFSHKDLMYLISTLNTELRKLSEWVKSEYTFTELKENKI